MNKFNTLLEGTFSRFQGGGFLTGDIVKFKPDSMNNNWVKKQPQGLIEKLKEFTECDENIRVSCVKAIRSAPGGSIQQDNQVDDFYCDIVREKAPGLFMDFITVPAELLEYQEIGINLPNVPDSQKRQTREDQKPVELEQENAEDPMTPYQQTSISDGDLKLTDQNINQPHNTAPVDNFTTKVYMQGF